MMLHETGASKEAPFLVEADASSDSPTDRWRTPGPRREEALQIPTPELSIPGH